MQDPPLAFHFGGGGGKNNFFLSEVRIKNLQIFRIAQNDQWTVLFVGKRADFEKNNHLPGLPLKKEILFYLINIANEQISMD